MSCIIHFMDIFFLRFCQHEMKHSSPIQLGLTNMFKYFQRFRHFSAISHDHTKFQFQKNSKCTELAYTTYSQVSCLLNMVTLEITAASWQKLPHRRHAEWPLSLEFSDLYRIFWTGFKCWLETGGTRWTVQYERRQPVKSKLYISFFKHKAQFQLTNSLEIFSKKSERICGLKKAYRQSRKLPQSFKILTD